MKQKYIRIILVGISFLFTGIVLSSNQSPKNTVQSFAVDSGPAISMSGPTALVSPGSTDVPISVNDQITVSTPAGIESSAPSPAPQKGWYGKGKKRYYLLKTGERAKGYKKIEGDYYFFQSKNGYAFVSGWKNVKINGKKYRLYFGKKGKRKLDVSKLLDRETGVSYLLETNLTTNSVMVYAKWNTEDYMIPVRRMRCSAGMPGHGTITGTYRLYQTGSRWRVLRYGSYGQYCSRISGPYLYHSVVYDRYGDNYSLNLAEYKKLGKSASHGCIRLQVEDAKWVYDHAGLCTAHLYYGSKEKLPLPYPAKKKVGMTQDEKYYDPTDDVSTQDDSSAQND